MNEFNAKLAGGLGFEPRLAESESAVLPLDDPPMRAGLQRVSGWRVDSPGGLQVQALVLTWVPPLVRAELLDEARQALLRLGRFG